MIEDVYVFDHYKDELYIISTNLFSQVKQDVLIQRVKERIEDLKAIQVYQPKVSFQVQDKQIEANVSEQHFMNIVSDLKKKNNRRGYVPSCSITYLSIQTSL